VRRVTRGRFITFEGGEGAGKSTQARQLVERLQAAGRTVVLTREPGGSEGAEALRPLLVTGDRDRWTPTAETLLMYAGRSDHLTRLIRPALEAGTWVVCDRFSDSTRAYQGAGGGVDPAFIEAIEAEVVGPDRPDLTLVFDMPVEVGLERAFGRDMFEARFESKGLEFHERLRAEFLAIARREPVRCALINAGGSLEAVAREVWAAVSSRLDVGA
jgi:dTMP kinase